MESKNSSSELSGFEHLSLNIANSALYLEHRMCTINVSCIKITKKENRIKKIGGKEGGRKGRREEENIIKTKL